MSHARPSIRFALCFALALLSGCKSGVERDVVQREMRQQEDQIYALEDYLTEYQQLLCAARNENAMLKRQMVKGQFREGGTSRESDDSNTLPSPPDSPPTNPSDATPDVAPTITPPEVPPLDLSEPSAPAPGDSSANEPEMIAQEVQQASAEIEFVPEVTPEIIPTATAAVVVRGEVQLDDLENGPRVLAEVEPVTDAGEATDFRGRLSILVLDPASREKEQQLARWDFDADALEPMAKQTKGGTTFEFPLQLPPDAPTGRPLELWVRLMPEDGEKILGRTMMDLSREGQFASADAKPAVTRERKPRHPVQVAAAELPIERSRPVQSHRRNARDLENGWEIARPGDKPKTSAAAKPGAEWKIATRPVPEVESTPVAQSTTVQRGSTPGSDDDRYGAAAPEWSPERADDGESTQTEVPTWSPTR